MSNLLVDDTDGVRLITFNRPEKLNAFDSALYNAAGAALEDARDDDDVKCVVLTGAGRAFSAGQDLAEMASIQPGTTRATEISHGFPRFLDTAAVFEKPLLAAVNGLGVGLGLTLLLHCDLALIADTAKLRAPFVPLGVVPEAAGSLLMPVIMGNQRASLAIYTGDWITADEAVAANLALRVVPADAVVEETLDDRAPDRRASAALAGRDQVGRRRRPHRRHQARPPARGCDVRSPRRRRRQQRCARRLPRRRYLALTPP